MFTRFPRFSFLLLLAVLVLMLPLWCDAASTRTSTLTRTVTSTDSPSEDISQSFSQSLSEPSLSEDLSESFTPSLSEPSLSGDLSHSFSASLSQPSHSGDLSQSFSPSMSKPSLSEDLSQSFSPSPSLSNTQLPTETPSMSLSESATDDETVSMTISLISLTQSPTRTHTFSETHSATGTRTAGTNSSELTESMSLSVTRASGSSSVSSVASATLSLAQTISSTETAPSLSSSLPETLSDSQSVSRHRTSMTVVASDSASLSQESLTQSYSGNVSATDSKSLEATDTRTRQIFPSWSSALEDASVGMASASVAAGIIAAVVGGASPLSVLAAQRVNTLATFRRCRAPDPVYSLSVVESPTRLSLGSEQPGGRDSGAALGNTLVIGGLALLMYAAARWKTISKDRNLAESLNNVYFPPLLAIVALALWQPTVAGSAGGMAFGASVTQILVAVVVLLLSLAIWIALFYVTLVRQFRPTFVWKQVQADEAERRGGLLKKGDWNPFFFYLIEKPIPRPAKRNGPQSPLAAMADAISYRQGEWRVDEKVLRGMHKPSYIRDLPSVERGSKPLASVMKTTHEQQKQSGQNATAKSPGTKRGGGGGGEEDDAAPPPVIVSSAAAAAIAAATGTRLPVTLLNAGEEAKGRREQVELEKQPQFSQLTRREYFWWRNAHDAFFFFVTDRARWFLVAEWSVSLLFGLMAAISRKVSCTVAGALLFLPLVVYLALLMWLRPFAVNFDNVTLAALTVLMCVSLVLVLLAVNASDEEAFPNFNPTSGLMPLNEVVLLVIGLLILLRALSDLYRVLRTLWRDRQKAKADEAARIQHEREEEDKKRMKLEEEERREMTRLENPLLLDQSATDSMPLDKLEEHYQQLVDMGKMDTETAHKLMAADMERREGEEAMEYLSMGGGGGGRIRSHKKPSAAAAAGDDDAEVLSIGDPDELDDDEMALAAAEGGEGGGGGWRRRRWKKQRQPGDDIGEDDEEESYDDDSDVDGDRSSSSAAPAGGVVGSKSSSNSNKSLKFPGNNFLANITKAAVRKLQRGNPDDELGVDEQELRTVLPQKVRAAYARDKALLQAEIAAKKARQQAEDDAYLQQHLFGGRAPSAASYVPLSQKPKPIDPAILHRGGNSLAADPRQHKRYSEPKKMKQILKGAFNWESSSSSSSSSLSGSEDGDNKKSSRGSSVLSLDPNAVDDDDGSTPPLLPAPVVATAASTSSSPAKPVALVPEHKPSSSPSAARSTKPASAAAVAVRPPTPPSIPLPQAEKFQEPTAVVKKPPRNPTSEDTFASAILGAHNALRALHGAPPLSWDLDCVAAAARCANECESSKKMTHCHANGALGEHGQNIYWASDGGSPESAVQQWYNESVKPGYDFSKDGASQKGTGHFTQVVWLATTRVGAARVGKYTVCNYFPSGNIVGRYQANVQPPGTAHAAVAVTAPAPAAHRSPTRGPGPRRPTPPEDHSPATAPSTPPERQLPSSVKQLQRKNVPQLHGEAQQLDFENL